MIQATNQMAITLVKDIVERLLIDDPREIDLDPIERNIWALRTVVDALRRQTVEKSSS